MPSTSYIPTSSKGLVKGFNKRTIGGEIPLLLSKIIKHPIKGGALEQEPTRANIMVGQITTKISTPEKSASEGKTLGGELLNNLSKLKFGKGTKSRTEDKIRFIF